MKPVEMKHEKSKMTILVQAGQVETAKYYGWEIVPEATPVVLNSKSGKGGKNGKSTRK